MPWVGDRGLRESSGAPVLQPLKGHPPPTTWPTQELALLCWLQFPTPFPATNDRRAQAPRPTAAASPQPAHAVLPATLTQHQLCCQTTALVTAHRPHCSRATATCSNLCPRSPSCDSQRPHLLPVLSSALCCAPLLLGAEGLGGGGWWRSLGLCSRATSRDPSRNSSGTLATPSAPGSWCL